VPTLAGTGSECSRTCVLSNVKKRLKLGMNSDHTVFDQVIMDPELTRSVPRDQFFHTGMDTYMHCFETLTGSYRNRIVDALAEKAVSMCEDIFLSDDMMSEVNLEKMMIASYLVICDIYVFCVDLRTNSDYFPIQHELTGFYNRDRVFTAGYGLNLRVMYIEADHSRPSRAQPTNEWVHTSTPTYAFMACAHTTSSLPILLLETTHISFLQIVIKQYRAITKQRQQFTCRAAG
jgi:hypothetical protein